MAVSTPFALADALTELARNPQAVILAGGTDLLVEINGGRLSPTHVIAVDRVAELREWSHDAADNVVHIGAGVPYAELMREPLATWLPALAQASRTVGSPQIRNAGTLGGNLGTCSPAGDGLPVLAALDATLQVADETNTRLVSFESFMVGVKHNALRPGELITSVTLPVVQGWQGYAKVGVRNAMVIATASSCLVTDVRARSVRVALGSVGPVIIRPRAAEEWVVGRIDWDGGAVAAAVAFEFGKRCAAECRPIDDHRSTAAYRRHAIEVLTRRQLQRAFQGGGDA